MKKFILILLFFECSAFAFPINIPNINVPTVNNPEVTCPDGSGATQVTRPIPFFSQSVGTIKCRDAKVYVNGHGWVGPNLYPSFGSLKHRKMRMCSVGGGYYVKHLSKQLSCGVQARLTPRPPNTTHVNPDGSRGFGGGTVPPGVIHAAIVATCPPNDDNDAVCKKTLRDYIEGRVTVATMADRKGLPKSFCKYTDTSVRTGPNGTTGTHPRACKMALRNRDTNTNTGKFITLWHNKKKGGTSLRKRTHRLADLQCVANNIRFQNVCECNSSNYEFDAEDVDNSCFCPGVDSNGNQNLKSDDGMCDDTCPTNASMDVNEADDNKKCKCSYKCPETKNNFIVRVPLNSDSCPVKSAEQVVDAASVAQTCQTPSKTCPDEPPDNHPHVTHSMNQLLQTNSNNQTRCTGIGGIFVEDGGVGYCEKDHICETDSDEKECVSGTVETDHGECSAVGLNQNTINEGCLVRGGTGVHLGFGVYGSPVDTVKTAESDGTCQEGEPWPTENHRGTCTLTDASNRNNATGWSCASYPGTTPAVMLETNPSTCICYGWPTSITQYTCSDGGSPSSQDSDCICTSSKLEQTCSTGYSRTSSGSTLGSCDCPDSTWTKSGETCSKKPSTANAYEAPFIFYGSGGAKVGSPCADSGKPLTIKSEYRDKSHPATVGEARSNSWRCDAFQDYERAGDRFMACRCTNPNPTATTKQCPNNIGIYNSTTDRCETQCVQQQTLNDCKCVKDTTSCKCSTGWTAHGAGKCRKAALAPPSVSQKICICPYYNKTQASVEFSPGDSLDADIKANPGNCCADKASCGSCCHQGTYHETCPTEEPDDDCPISCPDRKPIPSPPGGCCPDGTAAADLKDCSTKGPFHGGNPKGIDIAFDSGNPSSIASVYSTGSMDRPDYICWMKKEIGNQSVKVQKKGLLCPPQENCDGKGVCQCQSLDNLGKAFSIANTYCEYASRGPMRFEDGIIRNEDPSSQQKNKYETDIRFFKTTPIVTP